MSTQSTVGQQQLMIGGEERKVPSRNFFYFFGGVEFICGCLMSM